ncbi:hypothetical protein NPIL_273291 [Nephila pilipes]|uniref:Uncharacterized protein n=1 Tax=Nephila pilipes TaxID=299642 RepID=A0A8X6TJ90_NEPPI|nr:hypothetical protein NPIL_273291 [Nephila pilipes]
MNWGCWTADSFQLVQACDCGHPPQNPTSIALKKEGEFGPWPSAISTDNTCGTAVWDMKGKGLSRMENAVPLVFSYILRRTAWWETWHVTSSVCSHSRLCSQINCGGQQVGTVLTHSWNPHKSNISLDSAVFERDGRSLAGRRG